MRHMSALKCVSAHLDSLVCEPPLFLEVLYVVNGHQASNTWQIQKNLGAKCQVQLSLAIETQIF